jgi:apolipoprotein N-acyltransferase
MFLVFIAGLILPLAFAPFSLWPLSIISLLLLLRFWQNASPKAAFFSGWIYGIGCYGAGVSWVFISIHRYGNTNIPLSLFITAIFIIFLGLFPALQGYLLKKFYKNNSLKLNLIGFPSSWVLCEILRSWIFTGFPWLLVGLSQINSPLKYYAPIGGVYIISFLCALSAGLLLIVFRRTPFSTLLRKVFSLRENFFSSREGRARFSGTDGGYKKYIIFLLTIWLCGWGLGNVNWTQPNNTQHSVSLIQGNINPNDKFLLKDPIKVTNDIYGQLTVKHSDSELVIWPENSLPVPIPFASDFIKQLDKFSKQKNFSLILGVPSAIPNDSDHYYNSIIGLGQAKGQYHKQHLVPFGEYLPLDRWLRGLINFFNIPMSNFKPGPPQSSNITIPGLKLLPLICYEIAYPQKVRNDLLSSAANVILTISEDGWFGDSFGPHQHLDIARMRALETGRYVIRSTTNGISAIIDTNGNILQQSPQFIQHVLTASFKDFTGFTPWVKIGLWPLLFLAISSFLLGSKISYISSLLGLGKNKFNARAIQPKKS